MEKEAKGEKDFDAPFHSFGVLYNIQSHKSKIQMDTGNRFISLYQNKNQQIDQRWHIQIEGNYKPTDTGGKKNNPTVGDYEVSCCNISKTVHWTTSNTPYSQSQERTLVRYKKSCFITMFLLCPSRTKLAKTDSSIDNQDTSKLANSVISLTHHSSLEPSFLPG